MHPIICFYVRQLLHYLLRQNLLFYPAPILNINSLTFYIPYSISRAAKWLCPNLSFFFFFPFQSDGSGRSGGTISGGDTVCSPPHLHHVIESAKIVFVILGKGACFKATQGLLKWALVSCMISFRGQERSLTQNWQLRVRGLINEVLKFPWKAEGGGEAKAMQLLWEEKNPKP